VESFVDVLSGATLGSFIENAVHVGHRRMPELKPRHLDALPTRVFAAVNDTHCTAESALSEAQR
jgi:hypothetical protein